MDQQTDWECYRASRLFTRPLAKRPWITVINISIDELLALIRSKQTADDRPYRSEEFDTELEAQHYAYMARLAGYSARVQEQIVGQLKRV